MIVILTGVTGSGKTTVGRLFGKISADAPEGLAARLRLAASRAGVGRARARLGDRAAALEECRQTTALLGGTANDPANAHQRGIRAQTYTYLGEAYAALAALPKTPPGQARRHWGGAREMLRRSLEVWEDMRCRGILSGPDTGKPEAVAREVAKCDAAL